MIHILTGPVHSGKTTLLYNVMAQIKRHNVRVTGFLSLYTEEKGKFIGYDLYDLLRESRTPFIRTDGEKHWQRVGSYFFIPESLTRAQNIIQQSADAGICVVDEVGPLELERRGLWPALKEILALRFPDYILVVRNTILASWLGTAGMIPEQIFDIADKELDMKMVKYFTAE